MPYLPEWERLAEAVVRVQAASGLPSEAVKRDICRAIADQKIRVRPRVEFLKSSIIDHELDRRFASRYHHYVRQLFDRAIPFEMPSRLEPADLDWNESCFVPDWSLQPGAEGFPGPPRRARVEIQVSSSDVTRLLCDPATAEKGRTPRAAATTIRGAKSIGIEQAIEHLWPQGLPPGLSGKDRNRAILEQIELEGGSPPSDPARAIQRVLKKLQAR